MLKFIYVKIRYFCKLSKLAISYAWYNYHFLIPPKKIIKYIRLFFSQIKGKQVYSLYRHQSRYLSWIRKNEHLVTVKKLKYNPFFSIIITTCDTDISYLVKCLDSILKQSYKTFEICFAIDCLTDKSVMQMIKRYQESDKRIKVIETKSIKGDRWLNQSNIALKQAQGDFILMLPPATIIAEDILYYFASILNKNKLLDFIYCDEDKIDFNNKRCKPHFKPDFSPNTFMNYNYIKNSAIIRKSIINKVGGFSQDDYITNNYDLYLKLTEITTNIYHIPNILFHELKVNLNNDNNQIFIDSSIKVVKKALKRRGLKGQVYSNPNFNSHIVEYIHNSPLVSIIIPTRDYSHLLKNCLDGVFNKTNYKNFEVIVVDNGSVENATFELFEKYKGYSNFKVLRLDCPFNYSYLNNEAVRICNGEYILLLNNDIEVIDKYWLDKMVGEASLPTTGCVGIKLLYSDNLIQHAGVVFSKEKLSEHIFISTSLVENNYFGRTLMPYNYSAVTGACLLIKKDIFEKVGGLDENLTVAFNDFDLCLKVLQQGYYNVCVCNTSMYHLESKSRGLDITPQKIKRADKEKQIIFIKYGKSYFDVDHFFSRNDF